MDGYFVNQGFPCVFFYPWLTCEPDSAAPETAHIAKDLSSFVSGHLVLLLGHICSYLDALQQTHIRSD